MSPEVQEFLSISYQEENKLLHTQWLRNVSSNEYRAGVLCMKDMILDKRAVLWLSDSRKLSSVAFADQQWLKRELAPAVVQSELRKFARVLTEDVFNYIAFENLLQYLSEEHTLPLEIAQFTSVEAAKAWLWMD